MNEPCEPIRVRNPAAKEATCRPLVAYIPSVVNGRKSKADVLLTNRLVHSSIIAMVSPEELFRYKVTKRATYLLLVKKFGDEALRNQGIVNGSNVENNQFSGNYPSGRRQSIQDVAETEEMTYGSCQCMRNWNQSG